MLVINANSVTASLFHHFVFDCCYSLKAFGNFHSFILIHLDVYRKDQQTRGQGHIWPVGLNTTSLP